MAVLGTKREKWLQAFGSPCHLVVNDRPANTEEMLHVAAQEFFRLEAKYGSHVPDSIISAINQAAGTGAYIPLDAEARSLFDYVHALWNQSNHLYDPSTSVLRDCYNTDGQLRATAQQLQGMLKLVGWRGLELGEQGVRLPTRGMVINLDSCMRPYAVDSIRKLWRRNGVENALIELDREAVSIGRQADGSNWLVGVRHPKGPRTAIARLKLNDQGFAMRGNFERRVLRDGEYFGRALSPVDGQPLPGLLSVAVVADNCLTACSAASIARLKTEQQGIRWLDGLGLPWLAIDRELKCIGPLAPR